MNTYKSHKMVVAGKVNGVQFDTSTGDGLLDIQGQDYKTRVTPETLSRIENMAMDAGTELVGGYLVEYPDAGNGLYTSWSPAEDFEAGYDLAQPSSGESKIDGYRKLTEEEIELMNTVKRAGAMVGDVVVALRELDGLIDQRWVSIGATDLQKGIMALTRSIAKPEFF